MKTRNGIAKHWKLFVAITIFALVVWFSPPAMAKDLIALSIANQVNQAWINLANGVKEECKKLGYDVLLVDAEDKTAKQIADTEDALTKNPKILLLTGVDKGTARLIDIAKAKGIRTITLGRDYGGDVASFIGADNFTTGVMWVEWFENYSKGKEFKLILITGTPGAASSVAREEGANKTFPKYPNLKELARQSGYYRRDKTLPVAEDLVQRFPDAQGIMGWNDEVAMGALAAAKSQNRKLVITGGDGNLDALMAIKNGDLAMSLVYDLKGIGVKGVQFADMVIKGKTVSKIVYVDQIYVTKENVDKFLREWYNK